MLHLGALGWAVEELGLPRRVLVRAMSASSSSKTIYLVRHAQSQQNEATYKLRQEGDVTAIASLVSLGYDAPVSNAGMMQLDAARAALATFASEHAVTLVAHSPLQRAVATAHACFGDRVANFVERPEMYERTVSEYFMPSLMDARVEQLRQWLTTREERVIALVGHGQYFKRCLGMPRVMENIEVVECSFNSTTGFGIFSSVFGGYPDPNHGDGGAQPAAAKPHSQAA